MPIVVYTSLLSDAVLGKRFQGPPGHIESKEPLGRKQAVIVGSRDFSLPGAAHHEPQLAPRLQNGLDLRGFQSVR